MKLDVFGRKILRAERGSKGWRLYYLSDDGKKRPATDIVVPRSVKEDELVAYLEDLLHEWATPTYSQIRVLDK